MLSFCAGITWPFLDKVLGLAVQRHIFREPGLDERLRRYVSSISLNFYAIQEPCQMVRSRSFLLTALHEKLIRNELFQYPG